MPDDLKALADHKWVKVGAIAGVGVLILTVVLFMRGQSDGGSGPGPGSGAPSPTDLTGIGSELSQLATGQASILDMLGAASSTGGPPPAGPATGNGPVATGPAPHLNPVVDPIHGDPHGPALFRPDAVFSTNPITPPVHSPWRLL